MSIVGRRTYLGILALLTCSVYADIANNHHENILNMHFDPCVPNPCELGQLCKFCNDTRKTTCELREEQNYAAGDNRIQISSFEKKLFMSIPGVNNLPQWVKKIPEIGSPKYPQLWPTLSNPCNSNPCHYGGNCFSNLATQDYQCLCPFPTGGKSCENDLGACKDCARLNKLVIFLLNDKKTRQFSEAVDECNRKGYELLKPKTPEIFNFTQKYLTEQGELGNKPPGNKYAYWIGLTRPNQSSSFRWLDDHSELGDFHPWAPGKPDYGTNANCVEMPSTNVYNFNWDNDPCDASNDLDWGYYPICSKTFEFY